MEYYTETPQASVWDPTFVAAALPVDAATQHSWPSRPTSPPFNRSSKGPSSPPPLDQSTAPQSISTPHVPAPEMGCDPLLRDLATLCLERDLTVYQIGCTMVHTLDLIQDFAALDRFHRDILAQVIQVTGDGFNHHCHTVTVFNMYLSAQARSRGELPTGIVNRRSIDNFTKEDLISLGYSFGSNPGLLNETVTAFWNGENVEINTSHSS